MAGVLPEEVSEDGRSPAPFVGAQVLESLTSGMYDDPLMIYREYVQNSVDAIDVAVSAGQAPRNAGHVDIVVSGKDRSVTIEDNGSGISVENAFRVLTDIGNSAKDGHTQRGFRGIGRLGGIGYCDIVRFETRSAPTEEVAVVEWDAVALRDLLAGDSCHSLTQAVEHTCQTHSRDPRESEPGRFFRVRLLDVHPFYDDALMDVNRVRSYLSQVAPAPYDPQRFSFAGQVADHLQNMNGFRAYKILVNGKQIHRPYADSVSIRGGNTAEIRGAELFEFRARDGACMARGWYASMPLRGALPRSSPVRGIRVRQGNIQVGDGRLLAECFAEPRFVSWYIGEIHVANGHLCPNARRDGFEQSRHYEEFLQQAYALGQHLSGQCREATEERHRAQRARRLFARLQDLAAQAALPFWDRPEDNSVDQAAVVLAELEHLAEEGNLPKQLADQLPRIRSDLDISPAGSDLQDCLDGRTLRHRTKKEIIEEVADRIRKFYPRSSSGQELAVNVLRPFATPRAAAQLARLTDVPNNER